MESEILPQAECPHPGENLRFREVNDYSGGKGYNIVCSCGFTFKNDDGHHVERLEQVWRNMGIGRRQAA